MKASMTVLILLLAATAGFAQTRVSIGIHVGDGYGYYPPPPPPVYVYEPPCPGPGYVWVSGYWYGVRPRRSWHQGYWAPPRHHGFYKSQGHLHYDSWGGRYRGDDDHDWRRGPDRDDHRSGRRGHRR